MKKGKILFRSYQNSEAGTTQDGAGNARKR